MKIETKFEVGTYVYFMYNNQAIIRSIGGFDIYVNGVREVKVKNWFSSETQVDENKCFATKEELINSL